MPNPSPDPNQLNLSQQPELVAKAEDKRLVYLVTHDEVKAYCDSRNLSGLTAAEWHNCQEVLTYLIVCRGPLGITVTVARMAAKAFRNRTSEATVERTIRNLKRLGAITQERWGRGASRYTIHFDWLAEIRATVTSQTASFDPSLQPTSIRQTASFDPSSRRIEVQQMTDRTPRNDGSAIRGIILEPSINQPSTTTSATTSAPQTDQWAEVVEEIKKSGVNQAAKAVEAAKVRGACPANVLAIVNHWREHRAGWPQYAAQILFRRIENFASDQPPTADWPPFAPPYAARLERQQSRARNAAAGDRLLAERQAHLADRAALSAAHEASGVTLLEMSRGIDPVFAAEMELAWKRQEAREESRQAAIALARRSEE